MNLKLAEGEQLVGIASAGGTMVLATSRRVLVCGGKEPNAWRPFEGLNAAWKPIQDGFWMPEIPVPYGTPEGKYGWLQAGSSEFDHEAYRKVAA